MDTATELVRDHSAILFAVFIDAHSPDWEHTHTSVPSAAGLIRGRSEGVDSASGDCHRAGKGPQARHRYTSETLLQQ